MLNAAIGVKVTHVPYRDVGPLTQDLIAGRIDYHCPLPGSMIPLIQTNRVKGIATLGKGRLAALPNLATFRRKIAAGAPASGIAAFAENCKVGRI
jgi:tripartite-type tricarboxylate transporter receptor subunit TctC